jgi:hypothetical protein
VDKARLRLDTTLLGDLGIDGDDGLELMADFGRKFNVDLMQFEPSKHFGPEGGCFPPLALYVLLRTWVMGDPHEAVGLLPISIRDLVRAAEAGKW